MEHPYPRRGMNGLEFARCTTAGGFDRVLIHAAPGKAKVEIIAADDRVVARGDVERDGSTLHRSEVWPTDELYGLPVLLAGGEVGLLQKWHHAENHSWWRWSVEFSKHTGRPDNWAPPGQQIRRTARRRGSPTPAFGEGWPSSPSQRWPELMPYGSTSGRLC